MEPIESRGERSEPIEHASRVAIQGYIAKGVAFLCIFLVDAIGPHLSPRIDAAVSGLAPCTQGVCSGDWATAESLLASAAAFLRAHSMGGR